MDFSCSGRPCRCGCGGCAREPSWRGSTSATYATLGSPGPTPITRWASPSGAVDRPDSSFIMPSRVSEESMDGMDGKTIAAAQVIEAQLNYLRPTDEAPYSYTYDPPPGVPARSGEIEPYTVPIRNGRVIADALSLDRDGILL